MKKIIYSISIIILLITPLSAVEKKDCSGIKKFSKTYFSCKSNNLKKGIRDRTSKKGNPFKTIIDYQKKAWSKQN